MKTYVCGICGYVYDKATGIPDSGIAPGTRWEELPDGWVCPWCGASRAMFKEKEGAEDIRKEAEVSGDGKPGGESATYTVGTGIHKDRLREMSEGEMSALCSNLARGCEKQYLAEEADLYNQLADYFRKRAAGSEAREEELSLLVKKDLEKAFPRAENAAGEERDRGAMRALVWSRKVTGMMDFLLSRYRTEGEGFLEHTNVYVCDICGFIYVGDIPPDICPVCKVPNWKMSKIDRG